MAIQKRMNELAKEDFKQRHLNQVGETKKQKLSQYVMRLEEEDYNHLKRHFQSKGLSLSSGVRMVIKDYLNKEAV